MTSTLRRQSLALALCCLLVGPALGMMPGPMVPNPMPYMPHTMVNRQSGGISGILGNIGSFLPSVVNSAFPILLAMGLGALLMPLVGGAFFLQREGQKRGFPSVNPAILDGLTDVLERVIKALDQADKKY